MNPRFKARGAPGSPPRAVRDLIEEYRRRSRLPGLIAALAAALAARRRTMATRRSALGASSGSCGSASITDLSPGQPRGCDRAADTLAEISSRRSSPTAPGSSVFARPISWPPTQYDVTDLRLAQPSFE